MKALDVTYGFDNSTSTYHQCQSKNHVPSADEKLLVLYTKIITTFLLCILLLLIITMSVLDLCNSVHTLTLSSMFSGKIAITMAQWSPILPSLL